MRGQIFWTLKSNCQSSDSGDFPGLPFLSNFLILWVLVTIRSSPPIIIFLWSCRSIKKFIPSLRFFLNLLKIFYSIVLNVLAIPCVLHQYRITLSPLLKYCNLALNFGCSASLLDDFNNIKWSSIRQSARLITNLLWIVGMEDKSQMVTSLVATFANRFWMTSVFS